MSESQVNLPMDNQDLLSIGLSSRVDLDFKQNIQETKYDEVQGRDLNRNDIVLNTNPTPKSQNSMKNSQNNKQSYKKLSSQESIGYFNVNQNLAVDKLPLKFTPVLMGISHPNPNKFVNINTYNSYTNNILNSEKQLQQLQQQKTVSANEANMQNKNVSAVGPSALNPAQNLPRKKEKKRVRQLIPSLQDPSQPPVIHQTKVILNISKCSYDIVREVAKDDLKWRISKNENFNSEWDVFFAELGVDSDMLSQMKPYQKVNHFPAMYLIARKTFLGKNLKKLQKLFPEEYDFFPRTWILPQEINDLRYYNQQFYKKQKEQINQNLILENQANVKDSNQKTNQRKDKNLKLYDSKIQDSDKKKSSSQKQRKQYLTYIVKPDCMSQGKGIFLTNNIEDISITERIVVQEYMKDPYLIDNLKFDIRLYVLITSCDPLKIFLYHEGIVRFATEEFKANSTNQSNIDNMFIHLTNYAINKDNQNKFKSAKNALDDEGHKRSFVTIINRLRNEGVDVDKLLNEINDIIVKTMLSIQPDLVHNYRTCQPSDREGSMCFELLGFDIILDKYCKPYLLEVNHAPSFNTDTPLDYLIKKQLLFDTLKLLGVSVEEKKQKIQQIYDEKQSRLTQKVTLRQKLDLMNMQIKERQKLRDQYEDENMGGYDRIYPSETELKQSKYNQNPKTPQ